MIVNFFEITFFEMAAWKKESLYIFKSNFVTNDAVKNQIECTYIWLQKQNT